MDTEKAILDTELYQERLSFCVQILYKIVGFSQKVLAKKKQYNMYNDIDQSSRINLSLRIY